jgi:hypothetical protein
MHLENFGYPDFDVGKAHIFPALDERSECWNACSEVVFFFVAHMWAWYCGNSADNASSSSTERPSGGNTRKGHRVSW